MSKFILNQLVELKPTAKRSKRSDFFNDMDKLKTIKEKMRVSKSFHTIGDKNEIISVNFEWVMGIGTSANILAKDLQPINDEKLIIPERLTKIIDKILSKYSTISFEDKGSGGTSVKNFSNNIKPCVLDNGKFGIALPMGYGYEYISINDAKTILNTGTFKDSFDASKHTTINRTWSFLTTTDKIPKEIDISWGKYF